MLMDKVDFALTPTTGTIYTIEEVNADPIQLNTNLGYYTNFMNLLDFSAYAVPAGFRENGLPFGVTLFAEAFEDRKLMQMGEYIYKRLYMENKMINIAVCGAHMSGLPLNHQLTELDARFEKQHKQIKDTVCMRYLKKYHRVQEWYETHKAIHLWSWKYGQCLWKTLVLHDTDCITSWYWYGHSGRWKGVYGFYVRVTR